MTTPTREQVIQAAQAVGVPDLWLACMTDLAFEYLGKMLEAARAQALDEAVAACDGERLHDDTGHPTDIGYMQAIGDCKSATQALKGKP